MFASKVEESAAELLSPFGFVHCNDKCFPVTFADKDGTKFKAKPDFWHPELDIYVEVKDRSLNNKTSKKSAELAYRRVDEERKKRNASYYQVLHQWNHSAVKQGIVQSIVGYYNLIVLFMGNPAKEKKKEGKRTTLELIEEHGVIACSREKFESLFYRAKLMKLLSSRQAK